MQVLGSCLILPFCLNGSVFVYESAFSPTEMIKSGIKMALLANIRRSYAKNSTNPHFVLMASVANSFITGVKIRLQK